MKVSVKYLILFVGIVCAFSAANSTNLAAGIAAAGALIAYAVIEKQDMMVLNDTIEKE